MTASERKERLARKVVRQSLAELYMDMPFLDTALFRLRFEPDTRNEVRTWACDGARAVYDARRVLERYKRAEGAVAHDILHVVLHCVFRHMFVEAGITQRMWNLACDIAVELLIDSLGIERISDGDVSKRNAYLAALVDLPSTVTAERIFRLLMEAGLSDEDLYVLEDAFFVDDHPWYFAHVQQSDKGRAHESDAPSDAGENESESYVPYDDGAFGAPKTLDELKQEWSDAVTSVQTGLETFFARTRGPARSQALLQALKSINRKRYDYRRFLSSLCSWGEQVIIDTDGFDYIYYTFGIDTYGDMPLVEPLEYKDVKRLSDVVVALDTSGSVSGDLLQTLFERTYDLICNEENAHRSFRIHLVQCDAQIRDDVLVRNRKELDEALESMKFKGLGGTDYTPVFDYVDELMAKGEFVDFKGVIYFTDGKGEFPAKAPKFKAAFVIVGEENAEQEVPPWAIKLVMGEDEVRRL